MATTNCSRGGRKWAAAVLCVGLAALTGCGGGGGTATGTVSGTVKVDGQPIPEGAIQFLPAGGTASAGGAAIKDGRYSTTLPTGPMKVSVSYSKVTGKRPSYGPGSPDIEVRSESLPDRYNAKTELTFEVKPGSNTADFDLKAK